MSQIDTLSHVNDKAGSYELARFEFLPSFGHWKAVKGEWTKMLLLICMDFGSFMRYNENILALGFELLSMKQ